MIKSIIAAAAIATASFVTPASAALPVATCKVLGETIESMAKIRDQGIGPDVMYEILVENGVNPKIAISMLEIVYITGKDVDGSILGPLFVGTCVGESA
jgi:hypothetical protein